MLAVQVLFAKLATASTNTDAEGSRVEFAVLLLVSTAALAAIFLLAVVLMRIRRWTRRQESQDDPATIVPDAWAEAGRRLHVEPAGDRDRGLPE